MEKSGVNRKNLTYPEYSAPSAPDVSPEYEDELVNRMKNISSGMKQECSECKREIVYRTHTSVSVACGHSFHFACIRDHLDNDPDACRDCSMKKKDSERVVKRAESLKWEEQKRKVSDEADRVEKSEQPQTQEDEDEGIPIDHGNNREITESLELRFGKQGIATDSNHYYDDEEEDDDEEICVEQEDPRPDNGNDVRISSGSELPTMLKMKILQGTDTFKPKKVEVNLDYLLSKGISLENLLSKGATMIQIRDLMGVKTVNDLLSIGVEAECFARPGFLRSLMISYSVKSEDLVSPSRFNLNLLQIAEIVKPTPQQLKELGFTVDVMLNANKVGTKKLSLESMSKFDFTPRQWVDELGMTKEHLRKMSINGNSLRFLRWKVLDVITAIKFTEEEKKEFGFTLNNTVGVKKRPPQTRTKTTSR
jgi:hypothetical protein